MASRKKGPGTVSGTRVNDSEVTHPRLTEVVGAPGTAVYQGWISEVEKDSELLGTAKYRTYSNILANTTIVAAGIRLFLGLVTKAEWKVEPADDSAEAQEKAELVEEMLHDMDRPWHRVVRNGAMARFYGFGIQEVTYKKRDDGIIGIKDIAPRPQATIERWDVDEFGEVLGVIQRRVQDGKEIYLPREKIVYFVDDALSDSPEGLGLFRHLVKTARALETYELLEAWGYETDLRGIPIVRGPLVELAKMVKAGALSAEQAAELRKPLDDFIKKHYRTPKLGMTLDSSTYRAVGEQQTPSASKMWDVELLKGDPGPHESIAAAIERKNRELARVLGVEHLLLGSDSKGSHALSESKSLSFGITIDSTLLELRFTFAADLIDRLWELNGWDDAVKPKLKTDQVQYRDILQVTTALKDMAAAGAPVMPGDEAVNEVRDLLGLSRQPEIDDTQLQGAMNQALGVDEDGEPIAPPIDPNKVPPGEEGAEGEEVEDGGKPAANGALPVKKNYQPRDPGGRFSKASD